MELKDLPTQLIQTVVTMAAGTGYEPWVKLMLFIILGLGVARLAMHPMIRALAHTIRVGVTRATRALERAGEYPLEVAHRLEPVARYMKFVDHVCRAVFTAFALGIGLLAFVCVARARLTWDQSLVLWWTFLTIFGKTFVLLTIPAIIIMVLFVLLRLALASAFREWQGIKTGYERPSQPRIPGLD